jgi:hypothetical protein
MPSRYNVTASAAESVVARPLGDPPSYGIPIAYRDERLAFGHRRAAVGIRALRRERANVTVDFVLQEARFGIACGYQRHGW